MADEYMTTTAIGEFIPTIVAREAQLAYGNRTKNGLLGVAPSINGFLAEGGNVFELPVIPDVDLENYTEGTDLEYAQFSSSKQSITISTKKAVVMAFPATALSVANQEIMNGYGEQCGHAAAKELDTALAGLYSSAGISAITAGTGADIDEADILDAKSNLDIANAPAQGRWLAVRSDQYNALLALDRFTAAEKLGVEYISRGVLGRIHGFDVIMDNNLVATTDGFRHNMYGVNGGSPLTSSLVHGTATFPAIQGGALAVGQNPRLVFSYDLKQGANTMRAEIMYGVAVFRSEWLGTIKTAD